MSVPPLSHPGPDRLCWWGKELMGLKERVSGEPSGTGLFKVRALSWLVLRLKSYLVRVTGDMTRPLPSGQNVVGSTT